MLTVNRLTKQYKNTLAANNISFTVQPGEIALLLGPNGAGKSTTIKAISGLISYNGEIKINQYINTSVEAKRLFSYVPEIPYLFDYLTVLEHCRFIIKAYRLDTDETLLNKYLEIFEMEDKKDKIGKELSKGMQQKLSIICALISNPKMIMFDEPLVGLDPKAIRECKQIFMDEKKKGTAVVISTHIIDTLSDIWDKVIILNKGTVAFDKTRNEFETEYPDMTLEELFFNITGGR